MGGNILIMGASSHPTSEEPLTYDIHGDGLGLDFPLGILGMALVLQFCM